MRAGTYIPGFVGCLIFTITNLVFILAQEIDNKFDLKWRGDFSLLDDYSKQNLEILDFTISDANYRYKCVMPLSAIEEERGEKNVQNVHIETSNLLNEIYSKNFCSYRIESYWIYELCHGQYVKQYHETKNTGKRSITESYYLGKYNKDIQEPDYMNDAPNIHWRTLDGRKVATYAVKYADGTPCEILPGIFREITIFYACAENGNDNIASFEEVSSCQYEMIVVSKSICSHPAYRPNIRAPESIDCYSTDGSPVNPETEETHDVYKKDSVGSALKMTNNDGKEFIIHYLKNDKMPNSMANNIEQILVIEEETEEKTVTLPLVNTQNDKSTQAIRNEEKAIIKSFLNGNTCLTGGTGWWKFEICYGKHVIQFHEDESSKQRVSTVLLGTWNVDTHLEYMQKFPHKKPAKNERSTLSIMYTNGQLCEANNKNRYVEVRFRCPKPDAKSHAVSLFLIEPLTCEYLLGIESPWFCDFIKNVDVDGLPTSTSVEDIEN